MPTPPLNNDILLDTISILKKHGGNQSQAAKELGIARSTIQNRIAAAESLGLLGDEQEDLSKDAEKESVKKIETDGKLSINYIGTRALTADQLIAECEIDMEVWEVDRITTNQWEVAGKRNDGQEPVTLNTPEGDRQRLRWKSQKLWQTFNRQIKITFRRKSDERQAIESLLKDLAAKSKPRTLNFEGRVLPERQMLEISIVDPHFGMVCNEPHSSDSWDLDTCRSACLWAIEDLLAQAKKFGPMEYILFPFGNDYLHADNLNHTTTAGTFQPEMIDWMKVYREGLDLAIQMVERLLVEAPVKVVSVPGNHDRASTFTIATTLEAYFRNDPNVEFDVDSEHYKLHRYGTNLIGFEHGHSIAQVRMAAVMLNEAERKGILQGTTYREWHCGDQHRKGSGKPVSFEEQGVSIEYLPGLTPVNDWHKRKSFSFQKRGGTAFVWNYFEGPRARLSSHISNYTGLPAGKEDWGT